ncbi:putative ATP-dependent RNA helicase DBP6 [Aspergillus clavatus NRRL 1]|uniref:ATP-dependent RNA helicase n=1 Tax=Aspergillus clavatus (strain ATCC 1007 / CBS 513.65 / DSM 816 / NCTC 3887 / NRRL 1 / QM 1276 / 107) TaxID=344612 RepID=A1CND2_ASPCL|nr:DEAD/DEAH box helicase, putative [Aspergillus clavatus NRRL 1]EAW07153.1 DEAD/DEAH box helicase, putative [Aspergillus clavatus NRRL 1]
MAGDRSTHHASPKKESSTPLNAKKIHKRKRESDGSPVAASTPTPTKKAKKSQALSPAPDRPKEKLSKEKRKKASTEDSVEEKKARKESAVSVISSDAIAQSSDGKKSKSKKTSKRRTSESVDKPAHLSESEDDSESESARDEFEDKKLRRKAKHEDISKGNDETKAEKNKFSGILSKFERSAKLKEAAKAKKDTQDEPAPGGPITAEPVVAQGLEPLPQPEQILEEAEKPSYSSLPEWLANPLRESSDKRAQFSELGIDSNLLRVLDQNGYKEAFAVQSTVIPLLLQGSKRHAGDLCISAATGSGKTLSYVLPLVTALEPTPAPRMRGLIVVPTRELVKQAREACELCAAGSGLRVGSAVGNVAIKDEQRTLMRIDQCYGPEISKQRQTVDLTGEDWTKFNLLDYIAEAGDLSESLPGYIQKAEPNVDILICTPGRLVDHLRYTKGFTLEHLEWLVIDEADRLLNESFQEWVDVVMNSLDARKSPKAFGSSGQFMAELGLPIQVKEPRKVILSATMTRDVSKLNSLRLANPKLVIVSSADPTSTEDGGHVKSDEQFTIPRTLKEYSVSVGDGSQKPLYLLSLLRSHINVLAEEQRSNDDSMETSDSEDSSSDDSSSDESDSDDDTSSDGSSSEDSSSDESDSESSEEDSSSSDESAESESEEDTKIITRAPIRNTVLIFTKSSESASRLSRLISLLDPSLANQVGTIIKSNKSSASRKTLTAYRRGKISIIVATDRASRGLDLQSLTHVVNYDVPPSVTTYVHRVGRTARAGKKGSAWTLVAHREGRWFENEISKASDGKITRSMKVERVNVGLSDMADIKPKYRAALDSLEKEVQMGGTTKSTGSKA